MIYITIVLALMIVTDIWFAKKINKRIDDLESKIKLLKKAQALLNAIEKHKKPKPKVHYPTNTKSE